MEKSWKRKTVFPTIFPHISHPVINDSINSSLPTNSTLRLRSAGILLFCFLINKKKGSFPCGEDAKHQSASAVWICKQGRDRITTVSARQPGHCDVLPPGRLYRLINTVTVSPASTSFELLRVFYISGYFPSHNAQAMLFHQQSIIFQPARGCTFPFLFLLY